jgi:outer membrane receptor protein involved in Fe transport
MRRSSLLVLLALVLLAVLGLSSSASAQDREPPQDAGAQASDAGTAADSPPTAPVPSDAGAGLGVAPDAGLEPAPAAAAEVPPDAGGEMVVTGSRIKQTSSFSAAAPVQVIDRKELEQTGATNLADVVTYLTVSQGSGAQGDGNQSVNTVSINLRGLGEGATLVLLNGRRLPLSGAFNQKGQMFVDISTIPLAAVERVEVLKGGASAIYGSDAVAGVVNIITRKNFDGANIELDGQTTSRFDQRDGTASVALGAASKRSRVFVAGSYFNRSELLTGQRDWTKDGYINQFGFPGSFIVGTKTVPDPACGSAPYSKVTAGTAGNICSFQYRNFFTLIPEAERGNGFGSGEYDITKHLTMFGEILASTLRGSYTTPPTYPIPPPFPVVPANHVDNPFGQPVQAILDPLGADHPAQHPTTDADMVRGLVGLKGDFEGAAAGTPFESWAWEAYMSAATSRNRLLIPDTLRANVQNALNSCSNPADLSNCYNPFYSSVNGTGTPNSTSVINGFYGAQQTITDSQLITYNAGMTGTLFELPAGDLAFALGGEVRHESRESKLDHDAHENAYSFLIGNPDAEAARDVYGGYLELGVPIYRGVKLQGAGRVEEYTDIKQAAFSPSGGLTVTPSEIAGRDKTPSSLRQLQFRGNATSAYHAPNLYQTFPGYTTVPTALNVGQVLPQYLPVQGFGNPQLKPEHAIAVSGGFTWMPIDEINLSSDVWYYDYKDRIELENPQQLVDQFLKSGSDPRVIVDPVSSQISRVTPKYINIAGDVITDGIDFAGFVTLTNKTFGASVPEDHQQKVSIGAVGTYVLNFNYPFSEAAPRVLPDGTTRPPAYCSGTSPTSLCQGAGLRNFNNVWQVAMPRLKANFPITWSYMGHSLTFVTHYIDGYKDDVNPEPNGTFDQISAWITFDAQYAYRLKDVIGEELTFRIGAYNLFDTDPPKVNGLTTSYDYTLHDPRGRMLYFKLAAQF